MDLSKLKSILSKGNEIGQGLFNTIFIKRRVEEIAKERLAICRKCDYNTKYGGKKIRGAESCRHCGCFLKLKTRSLISQCPLAEPKWLAVPGITEELSDQVDELLENE